ncbi:MAG: protein translocase subunit SecD [Clostridia bacterium]|nr:protein translocase subunit SecD [Clostridia bacterium]
MGRATQLAVVVIAIIAVGLFAFQPLLYSLELGLDLKGGVQVTLQAKDKPGEKVSGEEMRQLQAVIRERVDQLGIAEPRIQIAGEDRLIVELAGLEDPEAAVELIGKTAMLEFKTADGRIILQGDQLKDARAGHDPRDNKPVINLEFNAEGAKAFAEATTEAAKYRNTGDPRNYIAIFLDGQLISNPGVSEPIPNGKAVISGGFEDFEEAANLAALLRGGALPVETEVIAKQAIGPSLGMESLDKSKVAVAVGLAAIVLFLLVVYRVPGVVANLSLIIYAVIVLSALYLLKAVLTLPGIAGLLLSVGMAVDANIIIYERVKDELRNGKTLRAAVESGFKRAFWTIFDANVTTLIAAAILYYLGSGPIRGFAVTLSIGIVASMFTAITLTRWLLRVTIASGLFNKKEYYGVRG